MTVTLIVVVMVLVHKKAQTCQPISSDFTLKQAKKRLKRAIFNLIVKTWIEGERWRAEGFYDFFKGLDRGSAPKDL